MDQINVIIMRGLPGSGKTSWVKKFCRHQQAARQSVIVCSADDYHINKEGKHEYKPENARAAHNWCLSSFDRTTNPDFGELPRTVIVDNTNTTAWEIAPYYRLAESRGSLEVRIIYVYCPLEVILATDEHGQSKRNTHNVPTATLLALWQNLQTERLPSWWKQDVIYNP